MTEKKSFILYHDLCEIFAELTDEQAGQLIKEIAIYAKSITQNNPQKPTGLSGLLNAIASPFKNHIDRDFAAWLNKRKNNVENGKKGGRPPKKKNPNNPVKGVTVTDTVTVTESNKITLSSLSVNHIHDWLTKKRAEGKYINHDEHYILEYFKNYCQSKGKKYSDYVAAYRNAFAWESCQPKDKPTQTKSNRLDVTELMKNGTI